jgi:putative endonuclease
MLVSQPEYFVYLLTNTTRKILYTGVTNDLATRITEHYLKRGDAKSFTARYYCYWLIYYEECKYINNAIAREKEIKGWTRKRKDDLISSFNPCWKFLNAGFADNGRQLTYCRAFSTGSISHSPSTLSC